MTPEYRSGGCARGALLNRIDSIAPASPIDSQQLQRGPRTTSVQRTRLTTKRLRPAQAERPPGLL